jgi:hypothetical protein
MSELTYKMQCVVDLDTLARIDKVAKQNGLDRTSAQRFLISYALRNMPAELSGITELEKIDVSALTSQAKMDVAYQLRVEMDDFFEEWMYKRIYDVLGISIDGYKPKEDKNEG